MFEWRHGRRGHPDKGRQAAEPLEGWPAASCWLGGWAAAAALTLCIGPAYSGSGSPQWPLSAWRSLPASAEPRERQQQGSAGQVAAQRRRRQWERRHLEVCTGRPHPSEADMPHLLYLHGRQHRLWLRSCRRGLSRHDRSLLVARCCPLPVFQCARCAQEQMGCEHREWRSHNLKFDSVLCGWKASLGLCSLRLVLRPAAYAIG